MRYLFLHLIKPRMTFKKVSQLPGLSILILMWKSVLLTTKVISSGNSLTHLPSVMKNKNLHCFSVSSDSARIMGEREREICSLALLFIATTLDCLSLVSLAFRLSVGPRKMFIVRSSGATLSVSSINTFPEQSALLARG